MPAIRAHFEEVALVTPEQFEWLASPGGEVHRVMLDRVGDEVAVATSLVRYPPGSRFPAHEHGLGEEYLVLEGEFADEHGRYSPGTYVRNPPGSRHTPFSDAGCVIWVKLRQFHPQDDRPLQLRLDGVPTEGSAWRELHRFGGEVVSGAGVAAGAAIEAPAVDVVQEVLVVEGAVRWAGKRLDEWSWLRLPPGRNLALEALEPTRLLHKIRPAFALPGTG